MASTLSSNHPPLPRLRVSGDATSRGRQYGQLAAARIQHSLATYQDMFAICDISWQQAEQRAADCMQQPRQHHPTLVQELEGIASGAGVDPAALFALCCRTEILPSDYLLRATTLGGGDGAAATASTFANECTALAFSPPAASADATSGHVWLAQNWDWVQSQRQALVVLELSGDDTAHAITVTEAGMSAKIGLNEHGLGVTLNILRSSDDGSQPGMPVHLLLRAMLECRDVAAAVDLAQGLEYGSSSNILLADREGAMASVELSPRGVRVIRPAVTTGSGATGNDGISLCHTNHFLDPDLAPFDVGINGNLSTTERLDSATGAVAGLCDLDSIKRLLSQDDQGDESICRFASDSLPPQARIETIVAVAMELTGKHLSVTAAQPSITGFDHYQLQPSAAVHGNSSASATG